jgi:hypothetical protein
MREVAGSNPGLDSMISDILVVCYVNACKRS